MLNESDIDLDDLETYLYGQVYHSTTVEEPVEVTTMQGPWRVSTYSINNTPRKSTGRYFENVPNQFEQPHNPIETHHINQQDHVLHQPQASNPNDNSVNIQITSQPSHENLNLDNYYNNMHKFGLPQLLVNPVNNIVVIPPSTQIITNNPKVNNKKSKRKHWRLKQKPKKEAKKLNYFCKHLNKNEKILFLRSYLSHTRHKAYIDELKQLLLKQNIIDSLDEIEINKTQNPSTSQVTLTRNEIHCNQTTVFILSSDDEECDIKQPKLDVETKIEKIVPPASPCRNSTLTDYDDNDDVIVIEPKPIEIIDLDQENSELQDISVDVVTVESVQKEETFVSPVVNNEKATISQKDVITSAKERQELLSTPDSSASYDFLDNPANLLQNKFNFGLHDSDLTSKEFAKPKPQRHVETESESTCSDLSTPLKTVVFKEVEFELPCKDIFSETNMESFGDYITPKRNTPVKESIDNSFDNISPGTVVNDSNLQSTLQASSDDSSSESDYDDSKVNSMTKRQTFKTTKTLPDLSLIQADDVDQSVGNKKVVPNIIENTSTPIKTVKRKCDVTNIEDNDKSTRNKIKKKKKNARSNTKSLTVEEIVNISSENAENKLEDCITIDDNTVNVNDEHIEYIDSSDTDIDVEEIDDIDTDLTLINCQEEKVIPSVSTSGEEIQIKGISHQWTSDKEKFYRESWGQENFDVSTVQKTMSDDPSLWKVLDNDKQIFNRRDKAIRCNRCREFGHKAVRCTTKLEPLKCSLCGSRGHTEPRCPNKMCTQCCRYGNYSTTFCSQCCELRNYVCKTCKMTGHLEERCPDLWRRYYLTTENGPPIRPDGPEMKPRNEFCCSGCATFGHLEHECDYYNRTHPPTDPSIKSYEDVYPKIVHFTNKGENVQQPNSSTQHVKIDSVTDVINDAFVDQQQAFANQQQTFSTTEKHPAYLQLIKNLVNANVAKSNTQQVKVHPNNLPKTDLRRKLQSKRSETDQNLPVQLEQMPPIEDAIFNQQHMPCTSQNSTVNVGKHNRPKNAQKIDDSTSNDVSILNENYTSINRAHKAIQKLCVKFYLLQTCKNQIPSQLLKDVRVLERNLESATNLRDKLQIRTDIDNLYEKLNAILFGIYCFKQGKMHMNVLQNMLEYLLNCVPLYRLSKKELKQLFTSLHYIFSSKPKNEDYDFLVKLSNTSPNKKSDSPLHNVFKIIEEKYCNFLQLSTQYSHSLQKFQDIHKFFYQIDKTHPNFMDIKRFFKAYFSSLLHLRRLKLRYI